MTKKIRLQAPFGDLRCQRPAPGQMDARDLRTALELIHKASGGSRT